MFLTSPPLTLINQYMNDLAKVKVHAGGSDCTVSFRRETGVIEVLNLTGYIDYDYSLTLDKDMVPREFRRHWFSDHNLSSLGHIFTDGKMNHEALPLFLAVEAALLHPAFPAEMISDEAKAEFRRVYAPHYDVYAINRHAVRISSREYARVQIDMERHQAVVRFRNSENHRTLALVFSQDVRKPFYPFAIYAENDDGTQEMLENHNAINSRLTDRIDTVELFTRGYKALLAAAGDHRGKDKDNILATINEGIKSYKLTEVLKDFLAQRNARAV